jgi:RNA polymerase sigma-70 factor (ECF subfamily)
MSVPPLQDRPSDEALLAAYARGDRAAALALSRRVLPRVLAQAQRMLGDAAEAEDVAQEAMLRLWRIAPDWEADRARVTTWLYRVVANLCTDRLRRSRRGLALDAVPEPEDGRAGAAAVMQDEARRAALRAALADLPERQARAVALRHLEGLPNPDVARIMGESLRTVESLVARGKKGLIARLRGRRAELGYDDDA